MQGGRIDFPWMHILPEVMEGSAGRESLPPIDFLLGAAIVPVLQMLIKASALAIMLLPPQGILAE